MLDFAIWTENKLFVRVAAIHFVMGKVPSNYFNAGDYFDSAHLYSIVR